MRRYMWRLALLAVPATTALIGIKTDATPWKCIPALACSLIVLFAAPGTLTDHRPAIAVAAALVTSAVGDYLLAPKNRSSTRFVAGIGAFLLAHAGYLVFALLEGGLSWPVIALLLAAYLPYYLLALRPAIRDPTLSAASAVYLVVSCTTFAAAFALRLPAAPKWLFVAGIASLVLSDTVISLVEFLGREPLRRIILPSYYLSLLLVVVSQLAWGLGG
jgi:hypothetical protein